MTSINKFTSKHGSSFEGHPVSTYGTEPCECCKMGIDGDRFSIKSGEQVWSVCGGCYMKLMKL